MTGIITADWHLRKDVPQSRPETEEGWINLQFSIVKRIQDHAINTGLDIYQNGDLYHRSQPYQGIIGNLIAAFTGFPLGFYRLAGNHDLPYHNWDNVLNSGWYASPGFDMTIVQNGAFHFEQESHKTKNKIVFTHQLTFPDEKSRPYMAGGKTAEDLLEEFPNAKWIFTGDYHKAFHYEKRGRHVVNPGCLTRQSATEEDYDCGFYVVDTEKNKVEFVSIGDTVPLNTMHLKKSKERETRIDAFMEIVESKGKVSLSYRDNLEKKLENKKITKGIRTIITEIKEELGVKS